MRWTRFWGWGRDVATNLPGDVVGPLEGSLPLDATPLVATGGEATVEGGTAGLAFTVPASGSQVAAQDGTATVATGGGTLAVAATGSEVALEAAGGAYGIYAYQPLGAEATAASGTATVVVATPYPPTGAEASAESGTATVALGAAAPSSGGGRLWALLQPMPATRPPLVVLATGAEVGVVAGWAGSRTADPWEWDNEAAVLAVLEVL